ncbi:MAG: Gfo/Idh/MocA family oxidoreductase [Phycisphaeraceae bacterium]|nr:Gfo/Idh/MocA family oxidoreductase [Phycisphaeraceae bacterium]
MSAMNTNSRLQWGIIGTGNIANQFAAGVAQSHRTTLAAVASRSMEKATSFAAKYAVPAAYGDYESLLRDPAVEAVYVSLPNAMHHEWTIRALRAGKHVLCEKPLASNARQAREMFDVARQTGRVLVEAFMYRSQPLMKEVKKQVDSGVIGPVRLIRSSFCFNVASPEGNVRFSAELAGGALMDIGGYCLNFSRWIAGAEPVSASVAGRLHAGGVDDMAAGTLVFPGDVLASFVCGMAAQVDNSAYIAGPLGWIEIPIPWKAPQKNAEFSIVRGTPPRMDKGAAPAGPGRQTVHVDAESPLYAMEADDFAATVRDGAAPVIREEDSLGNMQVLDAMRKQLRVRTEF